MMSILSRLLALLRAKLQQAIGRAEDPRQTLDDSYERQLDLLCGVRRGLADVAMARKRIELQANDMGERYRALEAKAKEAVQQGREDLARLALTRRATLEGQLKSLWDQYASLEADEKKLVASQQSLAERIEAFRIEKESMKATYSASQARVRANEAIGGISAEADDVGRSMERARDRIQQLEARAAATDRLLESGVLPDLAAGPDSDLDRQLKGPSVSAEVERQLGAMKAELLPRGQPQPDGGSHTAPPQGEGAGRPAH